MNHSLKDTFLSHRCSHADSPLAERLFQDAAHNVLVQLFRYTFVGGAAFLLDFTTLFILTRYLGIHYLLSAAVAFTLGLVTNYVLSISWVFSVRRLESRVAEFGVFALIGLVGLLLTEVLLWLFTEKLGLFYLVSKLASVLFVYLWNFFARRFVLFHKSCAHE